MERVRVLATQSSSLSTTERRVSLQCSVLFSRAICTCSSRILDGSRFCSSRVRGLQWRVVASGCSQDRQQWCGVSGRLRCECWRDGWWWLWQSIFSRLTTTDGDGQSRSRPVLSQIARRRRVRHDSLSALPGLGDGGRATTHHQTGVVSVSYLGRLTPGWWVSAARGGRCA